MSLSTIYMLTLVVICGVILAWNFVPSFRERLRGWSSVAESVIAAVSLYVGIASDTLTDLVDQGYIPENYMTYVPFFLLALGIWQRVKTKTPVGKVSHD